MYTELLLHTILIEMIFSKHASTGWLSVMIFHRNGGFFNI